nr:MAG TPA: hypothetical protein [Caudoviricetes sp.]
MTFRQASSRLFEIRVEQGKHQLLKRQHTQRRQAIKHTYFPYVQIP